MGAVTVTIKVESDDVTPVPIDGVDVHVYTNPGDSFVTSGLTGVPNAGSGEAEITLNGDGIGVGYLLRFFKAGVSFQGSTFPIVVTDPPSPPNSFTFTAHVGATTVTVKFTVKDDETVPNDIEDATIRVYDDADLFLTELETDANGEADISLAGAADPGQDYIVRLSKTGYNVQGGSTRTIQVLDPVVPPATNIFDFIMALPEPLTSSDPDMCLLYGYLVDASLQPLRGINLRFSPKELYPSAAVSGVSFLAEPTLVRDRIIAGEAIVQTDQNGYVEVELPRESSFHFRVHGLENPGPIPHSDIYIPDLAGIQIEDVLFPYLVSVDYTPTSVTVAVGETEEVELALLMSDQRTEDLLPLVEFTTADEDIATVAINDGKLIVTGAATGATTIEVARLDDTFAPRRPDLAAIVTTPVTMDVTVT